MCRSLCSPQLQNNTITIDVHGTTKEKCSQPRTYLHYIIIVVGDVDLCSQFPELTRPCPEPCINQDVDNSTTGTPVGT